jgi:membrane protein DedA with SNARE-associated domain
MRRRLGAAATASAEARVRSWYERWGVASFFVSRFLPGVRALVPPFAGVMELPALGPMIAIALASGLWYGLVTWFAFRAGANWSEVQAMIARYARGMTIVAVVLAGIALAVWLMRRRARASSAS